MIIHDIISSIEQAAPPHMAASWDRCGVQVAGTTLETAKLALALDPTPEVIGQALDWGAGMVLTHHPLGLTPRMPDRVDDYHRVLQKLFSQGAWLFAAHTSLDCAPGGPASWLAAELKLTGQTIVEPAGTTPSVMGIAKEVALDGFDTLKLPEGATLDRLHFDRDALRHTPQGFICPAPQWNAVRSALNACDDISGIACAITLREPGTPYGYGLIGNLPQPMGWEAFAAKLWQLTGRTFWTLVGNTPQTIARVAYCTGSGGSAGARAFALGADVFITGDVKHHQALELEPMGLTIDVGHHALEEEMMRRLALSMAGSFAGKGLDVRFFASRDPMRAILRP